MPRSLWFIADLKSPMVTRGKGRCSATGGSGWSTGLGGGGAAAAGLARGRLDTKRRPKRLCQTTQLHERLLDRPHCSRTQPLVLRANEQLIQLVNTPLHLFKRREPFDFGHRGVGLRDRKHKCLQQGDAKLELLDEHTYECRRFGGGIPKRGELSAVCIQLRLTRVSGGCKIQFGQCDGAPHRGRWGLRGPLSKRNIRQKACDRYTATKARRTKRSIY